MFVVPVISLILSSLTLTVYVSLLLAVDLTTFTAPELSFGFATTSTAFLAKSLALFSPASVKLDRSLLALSPKPAST